jgi:uncharacterized membrane protein
MMFMGLFIGLCAVAFAFPFAMPLAPGFALLAAFDIAAIAFLISLAPFFSHDETKVRIHARKNATNRTTILLITGIVMLVLLVLVGVELKQRSAPNAAVLCLILATLAVAWVFANTVYTLHYAYLFYRDNGTGADSGGIEFPGCTQPDYWDFAYFAFTLGMTFQTSDVSISSSTVRKEVTFHCLGAFVYNLGIVAFTINVLGSG